MYLMPTFGGRLEPHMTGIRHGHWMLQHCNCWHCLCVDRMAIWRSRRTDTTMDLFHDRHNIATWSERNLYLPPQLFVCSWFAERMKGIRKYTPHRVFEPLRGKKNQLAAKLKLTVHCLYVRYFNMVLLLHVVWLVLLDLISIQSRRDTLSYRQFSSILWRAKASAFMLFWDVHGIVSH